MIVMNEDRMACSAHLSEDERAVIIIDQTQLPNRQEYLTLRTAEIREGFHEMMEVALKTAVRIEV